MNSKTKPAATFIPLQYVFREKLDSNGYFIKNQDGTQSKEVYRLGIWTLINGGKPQFSLFDTGSDQFNTQLLPETPDVINTGSSEKDKYIYTYGNGTYGDLIQRVSIKTLAYCSDQDIGNNGEIKKASHPVTLPLVNGGRYIVGRIEAYLFRDDYNQSDELNIQSYKKKGIVNDNAANIIPPGKYDNAYSEKTDHKYYVDLHAKRLIQEGRPGDERLNLADEEGVFSGVFGAGDFLLPKTAMGGLGGTTTSGYIVAANGNNDYYSRERLPSGGAPGVIVHLDDSLRSQFTSFMPWGINHENGSEQAKFPGSNAPASQEYEGGYTLCLMNEKTQKKSTLENVVTLLDTGYGLHGNLALSVEKFDEFQAAGYLQPDQGLSTYHLDRVVMLSPKGEEVIITNLSVEKVDDIPGEQPNTKKPAQIQLSVGLDFFLAHSVMYDLENKTTAYSHYFISAHPFNTGNSVEKHLDFDWEMGCPHPFRNEHGALLQAPVKEDNGRVSLTSILAGYFGAAGVIAGKGGVTIKDYTVVRCSAVNTFEGETHVENYGTLELVGHGSVESSARLVVNGILDLRSAGNCRKEWHMQSAASSVVIRDLTGRGHVMLGNNKLVLKEAKGRFDGTIVGSSDVKSGLELGLKSAFALGGRVSLIGQTEISHGAKLHITESGVFNGSIVVRGHLIVDGHVSGTITLDESAVLSGRGTIGKLINHGGQNKMTSTSKKHEGH